MIAPCELSRDLAQTRQQRPKKGDRIARGPRYSRFPVYRTLGGGGGPGSAFVLLRTADFLFSSEPRRRANAVQFGDLRDAEWPAHCHAMPNHGACLSSASRDLSRCPLSRERSEEPAVLERRRWTWSVTLRASRLAQELDEPTSSVATQRHRLSSALCAFVCRVRAGSRAHLSQAWHARAQTH